MHTLRFKQYIKLLYLDHLKSSKMNNLFLLAGVTIGIVIVVAVVLILPMTSDNDSQLFLSQVQAQSNNNASNTTATNVRDIIGLTFPGQTIVHRGIAASEELTHLELSSGEQPHAVGILPSRQDGATYTGVLTFTATKPVEIGFGHRLHIDNSTLSQIDTTKLGELLIGHHLDKGKHSIPGNISAGSVIVPDYGSKPPYFSASIPFVGSSVWLRTPHGDPFIAVYEVVAEILQPQGVVDLDSAGVNEKNATSTVS
jgi:hypothetical protein